MGLASAMGIRGGPASQLDRQGRGGARFSHPERLDKGAGPRLASARGPMLARRMAALPSVASERPDRRGPGGTGSDAAGGRGPLGGIAVSLLRRRLAATLAVCALLALLPGAAGAGTETLKRSVGNMVQAPLDLVLSPVVAGRSIYRNIQDIDDTTAVRIAYPLPGFVWNTMVQAGASLIRGITGVLEFVPGLILLPFESEMDPLFDPVERNDALVDYETPVLWIKFGIDYTSVPY